MANYRTHVSFGAGAGAAVILAGMVFVPRMGWDAVILGVFFGFIGGMVPDLDHDRGHALRKITSLLTTFLPILALSVTSKRGGDMAAWSLLLILPSYYLLEWALKQTAFWKRSTPFRDMSRAVVIAIACGALALALSRSLPFGFVGTIVMMLVMMAAVQLSVPLFKATTIHRGILHSIPVIFIYAFTVYLMFTKDNNFTSQGRLWIAIAAFGGAISHLILDEIYSVDFDGKAVRIKRSFGTAFSFWKKKTPVISAAAYAIAAVMLIFCYLTS